MCLCLPLQPQFPPLSFPVLYSPVSLSAAAFFTAILSSYLCSLLSSSSAGFYPDTKTTYASPPLNMILLWPLCLLLSTIWFLVHDSLFCSWARLRSWKMWRNWCFISVPTTPWSTVSESEMSPISSCVHTCADVVWNVREVIEGGSRLEEVCHCGKGLEVWKPGSISHALSTFL